MSYRDINQLFNADCYYIAEIEISYIEKVGVEKTETFWHFSLSDGKRNDELACKKAGNYLGILEADLKKSFTFVSGKIVKLTRIEKTSTEISIS